MNPSEPIDKLADLRRRFRDEEIKRRKAQYAYDSLSEAAAWLLNRVEWLVANGKTDMQTVGLEVEKLRMELYGVTPKEVYAPPATAHAMSPSYDIGPPDSAFYNWHDDEEQTPEEAEAQERAKLEREIARMEEREFYENQS